MLRVIFDTNIYGKLIEEEDIEKISLKIKQDNKFLVYGFKPVRKELRKTPKTIKLGTLTKRNVLLNLYDNLTQGRDLTNFLTIHELAFKFYKEYRKRGGIRDWSKTNIDIDFIIVACACFHTLDVVVSNDQRTLLNQFALDAYKYVCSKNAIWRPKLWKYIELKNYFRF
jgi:hypothetical protein